MSTPQDEPRHDGHPTKPSRWHLAGRADAFFENLYLGVVGALTCAFGWVAWHRALPGWGWLLVYVAAWVVVGYIALPRLQRVLTAIYVPSYFIGRTRTGDGLLGDPVNLALYGSSEQLHTALQHAGWTLADPINLRSALRTAQSALLRKKYPAAPVSALLLSDRVEDFAYEHELGDNDSKRHHVRFWHYPDGWTLPGGARVDWLASASFDRKVGVSAYTLHVTHKIDPRIDLEREHLIETVRRAEPRARTTVLRHFAPPFHDHNGGGDVVRTDGDLHLLDLGAVVPDAGVQVPSFAASSDDNNPARRPVPILAAALMAVLSSISLGVLAFTQVRVGTVADAGAGPQLASWLVLALRIAAVAVAVVSLALTALVYRGSQRSRWALLVIWALGLAVPVAYAFAATRVTRWMALTVLLSLATLHLLTARAARDWTTAQARTRA